MNQYNEDPNERLDLVCGLTAIGIVVIMLLSGCTKYITLPSERVTERVEVERVTQRVDTVEVRVEVPSEAVAVQTKDTVSVLTTSLAQSYAAWTDGCLTHRLTQIPQTMTKKVEVVRADTMRFTSVSDTLRQSVPVPVERRLTQWERVRLRCFVPLLLALLAMLAWMNRRKILSIARQIYDLR